MRAAAVRPVLVLAVTGAVAGVLIALVLGWWSGRGSDRVTGFGYYDYSPPRRYVDYLPGQVSTDWWGLLWPAAVGGLLLGLLVAGALALFGRRVAVVSGTSPSGRARR